MKARVDLSDKKAVYAIRAGVLAVRFAGGWRRMQLVERLPVG